MDTKILRGSRLVSGLSQKAMAKQLGVSQTRIHCIESGKGGALTINDLERWFAVCDEVGKEMLRMSLRDIFFADET